MIMQHKDFILQENSEEIREKIKAAGIHVCGCAWFKDSCWLHYSTAVANGVHGVGYFDDIDNVKSQEEELARFLSECAHAVFCTDVDVFIEEIKEFEEG